MRLKKYIKQLKKLEKRHGNLKLYYGHDELSSSMHAVSSSPSAIHYEEGELVLFSRIKNAICIN